MANSSSDVAVFIDSTLETHLAILVSSSDTVSSLKRIIEIEHALAFPSIGDIIVKAVKVKRKGTLYHMSDSLHLNDMFKGGKQTLFIQIEAEKIEKLKANASEENGILDKSQPPAQNLQNVSKIEENKDSKEISTVTNHAINSPERKKKRKKPIISFENPGDTNNQANTDSNNNVQTKKAKSSKVIIAEKNNLNDANLLQKRKHDEIIVTEANGTKTDVGTGTGTSTGTSKVKSRKVGTKNGQVSQVATQKTENLQNMSKNGENKDSEEISTGTHHVIIAEKNLVTEANGTKTNTLVAIKGNQDTRTGTGTETKKMKSVGTKKEKKITKKAKVSSNDNAGEIKSKPNHEAEIKSKPNLPSLDKNGILQNTASLLNGDTIVGYDENNAKNASLNGDTIVGFDENNIENAFKFEIIALSSLNLVEKKARKKRKRRKKEKNIREKLEIGSIFERLLILV